MAATYRPDQIILAFLGRRITGYAPGSFITVERQEESNMLTVGAGGDAVWAQNLNRSGKITLKLIQGHADNDFMSQTMILDEASGAGIGPVSIDDNRGTSVHFGANARIQKFATAEYAKEVTEREWSILVENLQDYVGSNV